jgi:hypothetical protein
LSRIRTDERRLEHVRTLVAATERDDRALRVALVLVHEALRRALATRDESVRAVPRPRFDAERWGDGHGRIAAYQALVERVRERTIVTVPPGARVSVVSRGDDRLLQLDGRFAAHFPQDKTGRYAGFYPKEAHQAIQELCNLGWRGVHFVVFPATAFWWFDFYEGLASWLAPALVWSCDDCAVYDLAQLPDVQEGSA